MSGNLPEEIGQLEMDLAIAETKLKEFEEKSGGNKSNRNVGAFAFLIGLLGILFLSVLWPMWLFIILIGALTWFTALAKGGSAQEEREKLQTNIAELRQQLAIKRSSIQSQQPVVVPQDPAGGSTIERMKQLKEMLDAGLINPEEYETKKASLLEEM